MADSLNTTKPLDWRKATRALELQYDKFAFAAYRDYVAAEALLADETATSVGAFGGPLNDDMHEAFRRFLAMPAYSATSIALKLACAIDAENFLDDVIVTQTSVHAPNAIVAAFIDLATMALKEIALTAEGDENDPS